MIQTISMGLNLKPKEDTFKEYITLVGIDVAYLIAIMLAVMIIIGTIEALQKFFYKNITVTLGIVVFAAALLVFTFAVKKIQANFWYSHIAYGLIVLLISIAYCCVFHGFFALNIFIILNVALAIAAAVVLIAVSLNRLDLTAFTAVVFLAVLIAFIGLVSMLLSVLRVPFSEAVSELCLCFGAMFGLFLLGNTVRCCVGNPHIFCFAMTQAFFFWIFITLLFSAIYLLTLPPKTNADESDQEKPESDSKDTSGQVYHVK
ncbi:unnamed protein product [Trichobilharzia szidati]|nr:unnamed protein product [Trichobilharzia szidati]